MDIVILKNIMVLNDGKLEKIILQYDRSGEFSEIVLSRKFNTINPFVAKSDKPISRELIENLLSQFSMNIQLLG